MSINYKNFSKISFGVFILVFLIIGCGKNEEKGIAEKADTSKNAIVDTAAKKMAEVKKDTIPDLTGNWAGTFDQRSATMSVIKQTGKEFSAVMNINYRQPLNKTLNGTIDPQTKTIKMQDLDQSRFSGQYSGNLLDKGKTIRGTFILRTTGKSYGYTFKMK
jgi:hypothetical protein